MDGRTDRMSIPAHRLDLRGFLDRVRAERRADLVQIEREVDPRYETTAFIVKLEQRMESSVLLFKNVKGTRFPLVTNVCGSMGRLAFAMDCPLKAVGERYSEAVDRARSRPRSRAQVPCTTMCFGASTWISGSCRRSSTTRATASSRTSRRRSCSRAIPSAGRRTSAITA